MFQRKQFHFLINSTRIPGQASIRSYYAVTWNDDGDLIMPHCTACRQDLYWSHRKVGNARGAQIALLALEDPL